MGRLKQESLAISVWLSQDACVTVSTPSLHDFTHAYHPSESRTNNRTLHPHGMQAAVTHSPGGRVQGGAGGKGDNASGQDLMNLDLNEGHLSITSKRKVKTEERTGETEEERKHKKVVEDLTTTRFK